MENMKYQSGGSSSSSFTETLIGPKEGTISSSGHFGSVFSPSSMGLRKDSSHCNYTRSSNKQDFGSPNYSTDFKTQRINGQKESNPVYHIETTEPSYLSSSIYYGGQDVYPPTSHNTCSHQRTFKKGGGDEDVNGTSASRGNWWEGSLYY